MTKITKISQYNAADMCIHIKRGAEMKQTQAQLRATKKYHEKLDNIQIRVPKGEKEKISVHAAAQGESLNAFVVRAIKEAMEREI